MLVVKHGQNMIIDLDSSRYYEVLCLIIECLKFSPLAQALTMANFGPLVHLSKSYSSTIYRIVKYVIQFEVASHKTSITKPDFSKLLVLTFPVLPVDPESIPTNELIEMFYKMGYIEIRNSQQKMSHFLLTISDFKLQCLLHFVKGEHSNYLSNSRSFS
ncbi:unnamed protein product [Lactuca saligna]|uniref:Uncharacterized protein n=1 Tax=Lactuca saligna TaxID=75948 RepID=A0AA36EHX5_LACSI|nr:unnamed protein product [Lactuca saligna]